MENERWSLSTLIAVAWVDTVQGRCPAWQGSLFTPVAVPLLGQIANIRKVRSARGAKDRVLHRGKRLPQNSPERLYIVPSGECDT
ncbi:hypothetical protein CALVIDRAFT_223419 [Calocera viscosa TUFC12733]|uniref:Secreted protein n=1 Tax=Calocera viscosa (strain TUFC12733) TaxID=1330018 RepID=A0A167K7R7_CALVF|nr:hypothetical protein CALVIDRAFT_223419 [Calocera viscosa TUFC12733]